MIRTFKSIFVLLLALMALFYALQNIANIDACYAAIAYVLSMQDHSAYPNSIIPAITAGWLVWAAVIVIISSEIIAAALLLVGFWHLWNARKAASKEFNQSKTFAFYGAGVGIIVWFGYFGVGGGALMQMWQTQAGGLSLTGAFQYFASCVFVWLILAIPEN
jgi:predicted small integral membrane protein